MKKLLLATSVALALASSSAFAVTAQSGVYFGAFGGWSFADNPNASSVGPNVSSDNKNYVWGGTIGYNYAFARNWLAGLEATYINFGKTSYSSPLIGNNFLTIKAYGPQIMATGTYLMNNGFNVFGKVGAIDEKSKADAGNNQSATTTKWIPAAAAGVGYMPIQNLDIALQYEYTFGDNAKNGFNNNNNPIIQNAVTLGFTYTIPLSF